MVLPNISCDRGNSHNAEKLTIHFMAIAQKDGDIKLSINVSALICKRIQNRLLQCLDGSGLDGQLKNAA